MSLFEKDFLPVLKQDPLFYPVCLMLPKNQAEKALSVVYLFQEFKDIPNKAPSPLMATVRLTWWIDQLTNVSSAPSPEHPALAWLKDSWKSDLPLIQSALSTWIDTLIHHCQTLSEKEKTHFDVPAFYQGVLNCFDALSPNHPPYPHKKMMSERLLMLHQRKKITPPSLSNATDAPAPFFYFLEKIVSFYSRPGQLIPKRLPHFSANLHLIKASLKPLITGHYKRSR